MSQRLNWEKSSRDSRMSEQPITAVIKKQRRKSKGKKKPKPKTATVVKWHKEYLESGAQFRMSEGAFRAGKMSQWLDERKKRKVKS